MNYRRIISVTVIFLSMTSGFSQTIIDSGYCGASGNNLTWQLSSDSVLTIYGIGDMQDYSYGTDPSWLNYRDSIKTVIIGDSVTTIGNNAFNSYSVLTSIIIGNKVKSVGISTFEASGLTSITIPNSVTNIENNAFFACLNSTSLSIGNGITDIGSFAFYGCSGLNSLTINAITPPNLGTDVFENVPTNIPVYIPCQSYYDYINPYGWKNFTNFVCRRISGKIMRENLTTLSTGFVHLYGKNQSGRYFLYSSVPIENDGTYLFTQVLDDQYVIKAEPDVSENALPTYYGNTEFWDSATTVSITNNMPVVDIDIIVIPMGVMNGNSVIYGRVLEDDGEKAIDPVVNADVYIQKSEQDDIWQTTAKTTTNSNGEYEFRNLPTGKYRVKLDIPGLDVNPSDTVRLYGNDSADIDIIIPKDGVNVRNFKEKTIKIYPNPTTGKFTIENGELQIKNIEIYNIIGHLVFTNVSQMSQPSPLSQETIIDISSLPNGLYFLKINNKVVKIIKN